MPSWAMVWVRSHRDPRRPHKSMWYLPAALVESKNAQARSPFYMLSGVNLAVWAGSNWPLRVSYSFSATTLKRCESSDKEQQQHGVQVVMAQHNMDSIDFCSIINSFYTNRYSKHINSNINIIIKYTFRGKLPTTIPISPFDHENS